MDNLKGKTIFIGRDPNQSRLLITVSGKGAVIGNANSVPNTVSRCANGTAHAKIDIDQNGKMKITNLKPANATFVGGVEISSKHIELNSKVELGKDCFAIYVNRVIKAAEILVGVGTPPPPSPSLKKYDITPLKYVWKEYHDNSIEMRKRQKKLGILSRVPMFFTIGSGALTALVRLFNLPSGIVAFGCVMFFCGIIMLIYSFIKSKNDNTIEEMDELTEKFQERYVCPNPDCHKFLGNMSYKLLKNQYNMHCPYCKCEWVEKK